MKQVPKVNTQKLSLQPAGSQCRSINWQNSSSTCGLFDMYIVCGSRLKSLAGMFQFALPALSCAFSKSKWDEFLSTRRNTNPQCYWALQWDCQIPSACSTIKIMAGDKNRADKLSTTAGDGKLVVWDLRSLEKQLKGLKLWVSDREQISIEFA